MTNGYSSWKGSVWSGSGIPHYYGDYVRIVFIATAVLGFVVTPLWGDLLPFGVFAQVGASLLLVLLAALTSAKNQVVMLANATVSAVSVVLLETFAMLLHGVGPHATELFIAREAGVLLMLGGLYWSVKTFRAMMSGKLGHPDSPLEFVEEVDETPVEEEVVTHETTARDLYDGG